MSLIKRLAKNIQDKQTVTYCDEYGRRFEAAPKPREHLRQIAHLYHGDFSYSWWEDDTVTRRRIRERLPDGRPSSYDEEEVCDFPSIRHSLHFERLVKQISGD